MASSAPVKIVRKEGESADERNKRRAEKKKTITEHRAEVLRRVNKQSGLSKLHKANELVCPIEFDNTLPPIPVEPKAMTYPFDEDMIYAYDMLNGVSSEPGFLYQMHFDPDVGIPVNIVDPRQFLYVVPTVPPKLHELDEFITSPEFLKPATKRIEAAKEEHVEWMMRSPLMHLDLYDAVYKHADPSLVSSSKLRERRKQLISEVKGSLVDRIEASFLAAQEEAPVHPSKKSLTAKRVWRVLPDRAHWALQQVLATFDTDPDDGAAPSARKRARLEHSLVRTPATQGTNAKEGSVQVEYLLPAVDETNYARNGAKLHGVRNYHMFVEKVARAKGDEHFALRWDEEKGIAYFSPLGARATLTRFAQEGRKKEGANIQPVELHRRSLLPEEKDALDEADAEIEEEDPEPIRAVIAERRQARAQEAELARRASLATYEKNMETESPTQLVPQVSGVKRPRTEDEDDFAQVEAELSE